MSAENWFASSHVFLTNTSKPWLLKSSLIQRNVHLYSIFCICEEDAYRAEDYILVRYIFVPNFNFMESRMTLSNFVDSYIYAVIFWTVGTCTVKRKLRWSWKRMQGQKRETNVLARIVLFQEQDLSSWVYSKSKFNLFFYCSHGSSLVRNQVWMLGQETRFVILIIQLINLLMVEVFLSSTFGFVSIVLKTNKYLIIETKQINTDKNPPFKII